MSRGAQLLNTSKTDCMVRAREALEKEGYSVSPVGDAIFGSKAIHGACITCDPASEGKILVNIVVASTASDRAVPDAERARLQRRMENPTTDSTGDGSGVGGAWEQSTEGVGTSTWNFTPVGRGRYRALEQGLGGATGTAILTGRTLRIEFKWAGGAGVYEWTLNAEGNSGNGKLTFTSGRSGTYSSKIKRVP